MTRRHFVTPWIGAIGLTLSLAGLVSQGMASADQADAGARRDPSVGYEASGGVVLQRGPQAQSRVPGRGHEYLELRTTSGDRLRYALALPNGFEPSNTYPVLLAFPPGPQTEPMVEAGFGRYWGDQASARGWIVVSPVAPDGQLFHRGAETVIPALLDRTASEFQIEGGRFHVAGWSNGGPQRLSRGSRAPIPRPIARRPTGRTSDRARFRRAWPSRRHPRQDVCRCARHRMGPPNAGHRSAPEGARDRRGNDHPSR